MKKTIFALMLCLGCLFGSQANDGIVFTTVLENGITPVPLMDMHGSAVIVKS